MRFRYAAAWWSMGVLLVLAVTALSLMPAGEGTSLLPDKLMHFLTYFLLASWFVSLARERPWLALLAVIALGGLLEILQELTATRQAEWLDFVANTAGAMSAFFIVLSTRVNVFAWIEQNLPDPAR